MSINNDFQSASPFFSKFLQPENAKIQTLDGQNSGQIKSMAELQGYNARLEPSDKGVNFTNSQASSDVSFRDAKISSQPPQSFDRPSTVPESSGESTISPLALVMDILLKILPALINSENNKSDSQQNQMFPERESQPKSGHSIGLVKTPETTTMAFGEGDTPGVVGRAEPGMNIVSDKPGMVGGPPLETTTMAVGEGDTPGVIGKAEPGMMQKLKNPEFTTMAVGEGDTPSITERAEPGAKHTIPGGSASEVTTTGEDDTSAVIGTAAPGMIQKNQNPEFTTMAVGEGDTPSVAANIPSAGEIDEIHAGLQDAFPDTQPGKDY